MLLKNWSDEAFNASSPRFIASSLSTLHKFMQKFPLNRAKHICEGKDDNVFPFCYRNYGNTEFFWKLPMEFIASSLLCVNIFFVKALRQWRQIWEAMKRWNVKYSKKLKQWSDEAFNAGKEIEAMKRLTLHRIASSLHRFIAPGAQLCWPSFKTQMPFHLPTLLPSWTLTQTSAENTIWNIENSWTPLLEWPRLSHQSQRWDSHTTWPVHLQQCLPPTTTPISHLQNPWDTLPNTQQNCMDQQ